MSADAMTNTTLVSVSICLLFTALRPNHFPSGIDVRPTHWKWNHSIGHSMEVVCKWNYWMKWDEKCKCNLPLLWLSHFGFRRYTYRQNRDSTPHCTIICLASHSAVINVHSKWRETLSSSTKMMTVLHLHLVATTFYTQEYSLQQRTWECNYTALRVWSSTFSPASLCNNTTIFRRPSSLSLKNI